ncbi:MAG: GAF domain-containing protein, partial [Bacteroidota bacterium]
MSAATRPSGAASWEQIADLGEQLATTSSLAAQRDQIVAVTSSMLEGQVEVWLHEALFRLPDWKEPPLFPAQPPLPGMRRALQKKGIHAPARGGKAGPPVHAAVPLEDQGLVFGAVEVTRPGGPRFTKEELALLGSLARIAAVGLYASHRVQVERFRQGQLNLVGEVSAQIANVLDTDELARRVTRLIQGTFHYYYVAIFTRESGSGALHFRSSAPRKGRSRTGQSLDVETGQGLIGEVAETGEQIVCDDVRADPRYRFVDSLPETRSEVALPLKIEERVLGVLDVQSDRVKAFHPNDLLVLRALADNIARAVESARLYGDLRRRADQLTLIAEISKSLTSTLDLGELMRDAASLIHDRFGYPSVHLFSVHPNRRLIEYEAGSGKRSRALEGSLLDLDDPEGIIPWVARSGETLLANDVSVEPHYRPSPLPPR